MSAISITAASVIPSTAASLRSATANVAITAGQVVYLNSAGLWALSASGTSGAQFVSGIALQSVGAGQTLQVATSDPSFTLGASVASGSTIWLHTTAGDMTLTQGDNSTGDTVILIGVAQGLTGGTTGIINLNPTAGGVL